MKAKNGQIRAYVLLFPKGPERKIPRQMAEKKRKGELYSRKLKSKKCKGKQQNPQKQAGDNPKNISEIQN